MATSLRLHVHGKIATQRDFITLATNTCYISTGQYLYHLISEVSGLRSPLRTISMITNTCYISTGQYHYHLISEVSVLRSPLRTRSMSPVGSSERAYVPGAGFEATTVLELPDFDLKVIVRSLLMIISVTAPASSSRRICCLNPTVTSELKSAKVVILAAPAAATAAATAPGPVRLDGSVARAAAAAAMASGAMLSSLSRMSRKLLGLE
ncbi:hypothetical protein MPTK1_5g06660 [Marchantia polymorpha subsp. ruderalis]|uniref:Uncharacterized protein n=2 Tax=Marchantia polymorpha TaxID=3197 RepID=A0AAF6BFN3_MARPO|nr:hypothetical protein MARPO_0171s0017 [Marchantia polymorpha]BBN10817.1 hypothetical protein Mp_5g06660 [Marchantia polymorpha subsp. ruderalis]|eukprot:PTQ28175.1 hypothetical protein MARPO_0171s0017 [Marchantia polymorpha]